MDTTIITVKAHVKSATTNGAKLAYPKGVKSKYKLKYSEFISVFGQPAIAIFCIAKLLLHAVHSKQTVANAKTRNLLIFIILPPPFL